MFLKKGITIAKDTNVMVFERRAMHKMSEIQNLLAMNRFLNQVFEDTEINEMEQDIFSKFNSAVSAVVKTNGPTAL